MDRKVVTFHVAIMLHKNSYEKYNWYILLH